MKRKVVYAMAGILAAMTVLSGCGGENQDSVGSSADSDEATVNEAPATTETEEAGQEGESAKSDGEKVEIVYTSRGNADEIKVYQQAVDAFNESQDRIHVTFEASPSDGYSQQLITQLAGGTAADVIFVEDQIGRAHV